MKNIGAERQLSEYNHVYKENTAIYRDLSVRMGMTESTFWILYTLRVEEAPVTQSDMCAFFLSSSNALAVMAHVKGFASGFVDVNRGICALFGICSFIVRSKK